MIGTTISHYKIIEKLGEGGMGIVYKAQDLKLDRLVALKFLPHYLTTDLKEKERFYHEARSVSALSHTNVTTVYEIDEQNDQMFLAMEYVEGKTLKKLIEEGESLSIKRVLEITIQICDGLASAHEKGIVHRDIKSDNIMLTPKGQVKIMDFGLAKIKGATKLTKAGSTVGTAAYMSPEQAQGEDVDQRSDIFSFGVVLYELLTTKLPFRGEHQAALMYSLINEDPQPIARFNENVSPEIERIVLKALAKDKEERYQHIDDMLADLRHERKTLEYAKTGYARTSSMTQAVPATVKPKRAVWKYLSPAVAIVIIGILIVVFNPFNFQVSTQKGVASSGEKNSLAVMYFENIPDPDDKDHTGEMLTNLLITALFQVKDLEVISRERLYDIQKELGEGEAKSIPPSMATKVGQRAGVSMMLLGSILQKEPTLAVTYRLIEVQTGKILSTQRLSGFSKEKVFSMVDTLALLVKNDLNVKPVALSETKSVAEVTTKSPEAYRSYVEGVELSNKLLWSEAHAAFSRAVELDGNFAMAHSALSQMKGILGDRTGSDNMLKRAWQLSRSATERERLLIESRYIGRLENNPKKAAELLEQFLQKFPHERDAYEQLSFVYERGLSEYEKANQTLLRGLKYIPLDKTLWNSLAYSHASLNRREEAYHAADRYLELAPGEFNPYDSRGEMYALFGEMDSAVQWYQKAVTFRPEFATLEKLGFNAILRQDYVAAEGYFRHGTASTSQRDQALAEIDLALIPMYRGQLTTADNLLRLSLASHQRKNIEAILDDDYLLLALLSYEKADYASMVEHARKYDNERQKDPNDLVHGRVLLAWALYKNGDFARSSKLLREIMQENTKPIVHSSYEYASALVSFEKGEYDIAIDRFRKGYESAVPNRAPQYFYAVALMKRGSVSEAINEFQRMTWYSPVTAPSPTRLDYLPTWRYWLIASVKAHYWLGVAYEQQGQKDQAVKEYEKFLEIWKDADFKSPEIQDAKAKLNKLSGVSMK